MNFTARVIYAILLLLSIFLGRIYIWDDIKFILFPRSFYEKHTLSVFVIVLLINLIFGIVGIVFWRKQEQFLLKNKKISTVLNIGGIFITFILGLITALIIFDLDF